jgi:hypothetical protein
VSEGWGGVSWGGGWERGYGAGGLLLKDWQAVEGHCKSSVCGAADVGGWCRGVSGGLGHKTGLCGKPKYLYLDGVGVYGWAVLNVTCGRPRGSASELGVG